MNTKTCTKCGETKALDEFHLKPAGKLGRASHCKGCFNARQREVFHTRGRKTKQKYNPSRAAAYRATNEAKAYMAAWRKAHPYTPAGAVRMAEWRKTNPERAKAAYAKWQKEHLAQDAAKTRRRKAAKLHATPAWADDFFIEEIYDLAQRRTKATGFKWHVDHIVPLRSKLVCGLHVENNLQVILAVKNMSKGNRHWPDMPEQGVRYDRLSSAAN